MLYQQKQCRTKVVEVGLQNKEQGPEES